MVQIIYAIVTSLAAAGLSILAWRKYEVLPQLKSKKGYVLIALVVVVSVVIGVGACSRDFSLITTIRILVLYIFLLIVAWIDLKKHIIPNKVVLIALLVRFLLYGAEYLFERDTFLQVLLLGVFGALFGFIILIVANRFSKGGLGMGDVKMYMIIGCYIGIYGTYNVMFYAVIIMLVFCGLLLLLRKLNKKSQVPFAPFTLPAYCLILLMGAL